MSHEPWPFRHDSEQPPAEPIVSQETPLLFPSLGPSHYFTQESLSSGVLYNFGPFFFCILFFIYLLFKFRQRQSHPSKTQKVRNTMI